MKNIIVCVAVATLASVVTMGATARPSQAQGTGHGVPAGGGCACNAAQCCCGGTTGYLIGDAKITCNKNSPY